MRRNGAGPEGGKGAAQHLEAGLLPLGLPRRRKRRHRASLDVGLRYLQQRPGVLGFTV